MEAEAEVAPKEQVSEKRPSDAVAGINSSGSGSGASPPKPAPKPPSPPDLCSAAADPEFLQFEAPDEPM
jgi:hypothetical protein